jgi:menaquinone-9 beta-reductase
LFVNHNDIVILGAGPAGISAALFLSQKGIKCTLIEKKNFPRDKICGDALSGKVFNILKHLNPNIINELKSFDNAIGCWGIKFVAPNKVQTNIPFKVNFANPSSTLPSGYVMKRIHFDNYLYNWCLKSNNIQLMTDVEYSIIEKKENGYQIELSSKEIINTKFILCADGAHSKFAKEFGNIHLEHKHYCGSVRAYFDNVTKFENGNFLELYFLKKVLPGYFWIFPLPNGGVNVGLGMRSDYISKDSINLKKLFFEIIEGDETIKSRFANAKMNGKLEGFGIPLGSKKRKISGENFMLLGDAASLVDPFTGEGISNAMLSGKIAAEVLEKMQAGKLKLSENHKYDQLVYKKIGQELKLSRLLQNLSKYPWLMNLVISKANKNQEFRETITSMFDNIDLRKKFSNPMFYFRILFK